MRPVIGLTSRTLPLPATKKQRPTETVTRTYVEALERAGALCLLIPNVDPDRAGAYLDRVDGLLLTGGDDPDPSLFGEEPHPRIDLVDERRDRFEIALTTGARERGLPVFGICRGVQLMNIALGGDIFQDIESQTESLIQHTQRRLDDGPWHEVAVAEGSRLAAILGSERLRVNSFHHQACRRPGEGLAVSAASADGLAEAVEDPSRPFFLGVQWHPELGGPGSSELFASFVDSARNSAETRRI
jgi:putative glutamine amidotransferase